VAFFFFFFNVFPEREGRDPLPVLQYRKPRCFQPAGRSALSRAPSGLEIS
jgi:hypothetical protein